MLHTILGSERITYDATVMPLSSWHQVLALDLGLDLCSWPWQLGLAN